MIKITKDMIKTTPFLEAEHEGDYLSPEGRIYRVTDDGTVWQYTFGLDSDWTDKRIPPMVKEQLRWIHHGRIA